jgi:hypothetical protein
MQTLKIEVSNSIYEHIMFFLQNLPKNLINISYETKPEMTNKKSIKNDIEELFKTSNVQAFRELKDPLAWQKSMRDEWE